MKKFVLKGNPNEEIKLGDTITAKFNSPFGSYVMTTTVTEPILKNLILEGIIEIQESEPVITVDYLVKHLAHRIGWKAENADKYLENLYKINPISVFQILLKECARVLDQNYKDHITNSEELWAISVVTGESFKLDTREGKLTNIALFRTKEDAEIARRVLGKAIKELF